MELEGHYVLKEAPDRFCPQVCDKLARRHFRKLREWKKKKIESEGWFKRDIPFHELLELKINAIIFKNSTLKHFMFSFLLLRTSDLLITYQSEHTSFCAGETVRQGSLSTSDDINIEFMNRDREGMQVRLIDEQKVRGLDATRGSKKKNFSYFIKKTTLQRGLRKAIGG